MHDVSNAINILDPTEGIDNKVCKKGAYNFASGTEGHEKEEMCGVRGHGSNHTNSTGEGLSLLFKEGTSSTKEHGGNYHKTQTEKMGPITSGVISKDMTALTREQHGVVSSAFAKAHEGAEIVEIRSISTTSVMVNAWARRYTSMMYIPKKNKRDVSNAINILDPNKDIDGKICGKDQWHTSNATETPDKCNTGGSDGSKTGFTKLSDMFEKDIGSGNKNAYPGDKDTKMSIYHHTTAKISKDVSALNREQKGVVSSAFAKAHEGAEIQS